MKHLKYFEYLKDDNLEVGDYIGYKRYLGLPPLIVKILSITRANKYFIEDIEHPHSTYVVDKWELEDLTDEQLEELNAYLNAEKYNL